ncbi:MAG: glycosyltransferase [Nitrospira sp.]|nr:glycosyltransferase [Nitrospira sp.]
MGPARLYKLFPSPDWDETDLDTSTDPFHQEGRFQTAAKKKAIRDHFDACAPHRPSWERKARAYYEDQTRYFRFLVSEGLRVLEIGSGLGNLLAALKPSRGLGIDLSPAMVNEAARRHPTLEFRVGDVETLQLDECFDIIILADVVGHLFDVHKAFKRLRRLCTPQTRIVVSSHNHLWEPILRLCEKLGLKMPQREQCWLSPADLTNLLYLADFDVVKVERRLLLPLCIPLLAPLFNRLLAHLPGLRGLCLSYYVIARARLRRPERPYSTTIVIPCRNEQGNIDAILRRIPPFGGRQEILFVDGHSTDGTAEEIKRVAAFYPGRTIKLLIQDGQGKSDAVRKGFAHAMGDILMTLDADATMPPEALPKFYEAIASGKGELIIGCRLIYSQEGRTMPLLTLFGNTVCGMVFSWLLNQQIKDTLCGTKVLFRRDYERLATDRPYFGEFDPLGDFELLFGASKLNLQVVEIPVRYEARTFGGATIGRFVQGRMLFKMAVYGFFHLKAV